LGEPSKDFYIILLSISRYERDLQFQRARDLAEDALFSLPSTQPEFKRWRSGLAWWIYAEAQAAGKNWFAALQYATLALGCWGDEVVDAEAVFHYLRLLSRIFRSLGASEIAKYVLEEERELRIRHDSTGLLWQLEGMLLGVEANEISAGDLQAWLYLLERCWHCLRITPDWGETLPVLGIMTHAFREIRLAGGEISGEMLKQFDDALSRYTSPRADLLRYALKPCLNREALTQRAEALGGAIRDEDLGAQLSMVAPLAEDAVTEAVSSGDADLFLLAAGLTSQAADYGLNNNIGQEVGLLQNYVRRTITANESAQHQEDLLALAKQGGRPKLLDLARLKEITVCGLLNSLREDEGLWLVAVGSDQRLNACILHNLAVLIFTLTGETWTKFLAAQKTSEFIRENRARREDQGWSVDALLTFFKGSELLLTFPIPSRLTIIPCPELFSFPFPFTKCLPVTSDEAGQESGFLGRKTHISVAPSVPWWYEMRRRTFDSNSRRVAWIGDKRSQEPGLEYARNRFLPFLVRHNITLEDGPALTNSHGSSLAVIVAHGSCSPAGEFQALTDGLTAYSPSQVASWVHGTRCVILCVCSGGHTSPRLRRSEPRGLVTSLLGAGVQCVIAARWEIRVDYAAEWMTRFLDLIDGGESIEDAAWHCGLASNSPDLDAAAWATMQVFGDAAIDLKAA
jgi:CHAT domain